MTKDVEDDDNSELVGVQISEVAERLRELKSSTMEVAGKRERLPQPLFWSLFHSEIKELKRKKAVARAIDEILNKTGT